MAAVNGEITKGFRPKQHTGHTSMPMGVGTAGGTIAAYDVVAFSSGTIIKAADDATATLVGVAAEAASSGEQVTFFMALPGVMFEATLDDDATTGHTLAAADVGLKYAIKVDPGGSTLHFVDQNDNTYYTVTVVSLVDAVGTVRGRVNVQFVRSAFIG